MSKKLLAASLVVLAGFASTAQAQTEAAAPAKPLHFFIGIGATGGGDKLVTAQYTNGTSVDITGGGLVQFNGGVDYQFTDKFSGSLGLGYHFDRANASNGSITFSRLPVEVLAHYSVTPSVRLGGGLRLVSGAKLRSDGVASGIDADFASTTGLVLEGEYLLNARYGFKLRVVEEKYKSNATQKTISGSHAGLMFNFYF
jgi:opacity protein-like surface antigen